jgi:phosphoribosyl 1,2-cyclic phosphodiesterase
MADSITVTFWGVRGSYPMPGLQTVRVGGNTTCVQVQAGNHQIILDAGTGVIALGQLLVAQYRQDKKPITATMLFTHTHHDHTQGFPFFAPTHFQTTTLYAFGPKTLHEDLEEVLGRAMLPPVFPIRLDELPCVRVICNLHEAETIVFDSQDAEPHVYSRTSTVPDFPDSVKIKVLHSYAHPQGVFIYRIEHNNKSVVFATDTEGYKGGDQRLIRFARGANLLIHDAQYTQEEYASTTSPTQGWGHSTWNMAVQVARAAQVEKLVLTHHEPMHSDEILEVIESQAQKEFPQTILAREGLKLVL